MRGLWRVLVAGVLLLGMGQTVGMAQDADELLPRDTAEAVAAVLSSQYGEVVAEAFWLSREAPVTSGGRRSDRPGLSGNVALALAGSYPRSRIVQQGMDQVRCGPEQTDREPHGCPILNGWPIVFVTGIQVLEDGTVAVSVHVKAQYGNRSASSGVAAQVARSHGGWEVVAVTEKWAT